MKKKIVLVGGGSNAWAPQLMVDFLHAETLNGATYVLLDLNADAARKVAAFANRVKEARGVAADIVATADSRAAYRDADVVVITISTGGLQAMAHDLKIPEDYRIYHTVGDTVGPGGWARAMRNIPVFVRIGETISKLAPKAFVLNYSNPMTTLTRTLALACKRPVVGLCHGFFEDLHVIQKIYGLASEDEIKALYGGVNHFFWITRCRAGGVDVLADLRARVARSSLPAICGEAFRDAMGYESKSRFVADELFRRTGCLPYLADRHTCEFLPHYLGGGKANIRKYHLVRTTIEDRMKGFAAREKRLARLVTGPLPDWVQRRSRETAVDIACAAATNRDFIDVGNTPNAGQIPNLPLGAVVETPVVVNSLGFTPVAVGDLPGAVLDLVAPVVRVQEKTVRAALDGDLELAFEALAADPLCSHLTVPEIKEMGRKLLRANRRLLPQFGR